MNSETTTSRCASADVGLSFAIEPRVQIVLRSVGLALGVGQRDRALGGELLDQRPLVCVQVDDRHGRVGHDGGHGPADRPAEHAGDQRANHDPVPHTTCHAAPREWLAISVPPPPAVLFMATEQRESRHRRAQASRMRPA
ncbi:MAG: hypothetical protein E6J90_00865 [Deltaproteobacteria bacterium]|nr:MAG: hypothetical protein E6J90_00865 [Deltaproteobacteria bacterium]